MNVEYLGNPHEVKLDAFIPLELRKTKEPLATKPLCIEVHGCAW